MLELLSLLFFGWGETGMLGSPAPEQGYATCLGLGKGGSMGV